MGGKAFHRGILGERTHGLGLDYSTVSKFSRAVSEVSLTIDITAFSGLEDTCHNFPYHSFMWK